MSPVFARERNRTRSSNSTSAASLIAALSCSSDDGSPHQTSHPLEVKFHFNCHKRVSWHFFRMSGNSTLARSTTLSVPMTHRPLPYRILAHASVIVRSWAPSFSALSFVSQCPLGNVSHQSSAQCTTDHSQLPNLRLSSSHRSPKPMGHSRPCRLTMCRELLPRTPSVLLRLVRQLRPLRN